jgi:TetR/AcrR family transcriptional regulator
LSVATRKEKEKQERRNTILIAARDLFYDKGYQSTTVGEIADAADISKGTLYLYFASKDELYVTVVLESFHEVEERLRDIMASDESILAKGRSLYLTFAEHCMQHREYFRMTQYFLTENARENLPRELVETISEHTGRLLEYVSGLVVQAKDAGLIKKDIDPYAFAVIAWRSATGLLDLALVGDSAGEQAGPYPRLLEEAIDLLIAGASANGAGVKTKKKA